MKFSKIKHEIKNLFRQYKSIVLLIVLFVCSILDLTISKILIKSSSDFILFITFLAILWYSWETKKLREETSSQKHLNVYPFLVIKEYNSGLYIVNIGRGPAMWPELEMSGNLTIGTPSFLYSRTIPTIFEDPNAKIPLLAFSVGEMESFEEYQRGNENKEKTKSNTLDFQSILKNGEVILKYRDIYGKMYISKIQLTPAGPWLEEYKF
jgi:hypothetical protein